jgi:hypothetical protein
MDGQDQQRAGRGDRRMAQFLSACFLPKVKTKPSDRIRPSAEISIRRLKGENLPKADASSGLAARRTAIYVQQV